MSSPSINVFSLTLRRDLVEQSALNAGALIFLGVLGFLGFTLLSVLNPFIRPLAWAICVGALLNPIKQSMVQQGRLWLENIETTDSLLTMQLVFAPFHFALLLVNQLRNNAQRHTRVIYGVPIVFIVIYIFNLLGLTSLLSSIFSYFYHFLQTLPLILELFSTRMVCFMCLIISIKLIAKLYIYIYICRQLHCSLAIYLCSYTGKYSNRKHHCPLLNPLPHLSVRCRLAHLRPTLRSPPRRRLRLTLWILDPQAMLYPTRPPRRRRSRRPRRTRNCSRFRLVCAACCCKSPRAPSSCSCSCCSCTRRRCAL